MHNCSCRRMSSNSGDLNRFSDAFSMCCCCVSANKSIYLLLVENIHSFECTRFQTVYAFCVSMSNACQRDMKTQLNGNYLDFFSFHIHRFISLWICSMYLYLSSSSHTHTHNTYFNLYLLASQSFGWNVAVAFYFNPLLFLNYFKISGLLNFQFENIQIRIANCRW